MTKTFLAGVSAAALFATMAAAPAMAQSTSNPSWTGSYITIYGGATQEDGQDDETLLFDRNLDGTYGDTVSLSGGGDAFGPGFCGGRPNGNSQPQGCDDDSTGVTAGVRAGYDYQFGNFVVGGVADYSVGNQSDAVNGFSTTPAAYSFTRKLDHLIAMRARAGYAFGPALVYATGGYAVGEVENRFMTSNTANSFTTISDDDKVEGYQVGGGLEYRLAPNLSLTGEYLYSSLDAGDNVVRVGPGTAGATNPFILAPNTTGTNMIRSNDKFEIHAVNIGMSYRF